MPKSWKKPTVEVVQAMSEVFSDMDDMSIKPVTPSDDEPVSPADKQLMVRCTQGEKDSWKQAADSLNETLASFVRRLLNEGAAKAVSCSHPASAVRFYPWGNPQFFCTYCSTRVDMSQIGN